MALPSPLAFERDIHTLEQELEKLSAQPEPSAETRDAVRRMRKEVTTLTRDRFANLNAWQTVQVARKPERPQTLDYISLLFDEFVELHGDRAFGDDRAILSGLAKVDGRRVMFVGQQKGRDLKERTLHNYGMAHPEGYRKALLRMRQAEKFGLPIVCFIDTAGAYPGVGAEERGQAYTIAYNLREMARLKTPVVCVVIGEGGSGGALGIGIGDHVAILEFAYYSVISPEGCAGILWKHASHADKAAAALRFTSRDLLEFGIVDEVIKEPLGGAHRDHHGMGVSLKASVSEALRKLSTMSGEELTNHRYEKFRRIGRFLESPPEPAPD